MNLYPVSCTFHYKQKYKTWIFFRTSLKLDSPSCTEAQRVMRRRMLVLVDIADSRQMELCRETVINSVVCSAVAASFCRCLSSVTRLYLPSLTWCHSKGSTHGCLPWRHSVRPQGVQTCAPHSVHNWCFVAWHCCHLLSDIYICSLPLREKLSPLATQEVWSWGRVRLEIWRCVRGTTLMYKNGEGKANGSWYKYALKVATTMDL